MTKWIIVWSKTWESIRHCLHFWVMVIVGTWRTTDCKTVHGCVGTWPTRYLFLVKVVDLIGNQNWWVLFFHLVIFVAIQFEISITIAVILINIIFLILLCFLSSLWYRWKVHCRMNLSSFNSSNFASIFLTVVDICSWSITLWGLWRHCLVMGFRFKLLVLQQLIVPVHLALLYK